MNNQTYTLCELQTQDTSIYCKIVQTIGELPEKNTYIYDISYYIFFICFILVIISPIIILFKLINGKRRGL